MRKNLGWLAIIGATAFLCGSQAGRADSQYTVPCKRTTISATIGIDNKTYLLDAIERCPKGRIVLFGRDVKCKEQMKRTVRNGTVVWTSSIVCK